MIHRFRTLPLIPCTSFLLLSLCLTAHSQGRHLTLEQASGRGERLSFSGSSPRIRWAADGKHLVRGRGEERVWLDPLTGEEE
ncbi:MAG: hypothetical protein ACE5GW_13680, partial [Planctomycetota bacterium]